jgi:hypothetical protein
VENVFILPLEVASPDRLDVVDKYWIRRMGSNVYNKQHALRAPHTQRRIKWRLYKRIGAVGDSTSIADLKTVAHNIIQSRRLAMSPVYLLDCLAQASRELPRDTFIKLHRRISQSLLPRTGLRLPFKLPIPYAANQHTRPAQLLKLVRHLVTQAPLPLPLKAYYWTGIRKRECVFLLLF